MHSRPHVNGHQLHYDSDETRTEGGLSPRHPICSTVLYLSEGIGGPTLATNQRLSQDNNCALASKGWMVAPKINRLVTFDASVLHGVLPGRGIPSRAGNRDDNAGAVAGAVAPPRRLTFMVGFWREK